MITSTVPVTTGSVSLQGAADHAYTLAVDAGAAPANCSVWVSPVPDPEHGPYYEVRLLGGRGAMVESFFDDIRFGPTDAEAVSQLIVATIALRAAATGRGRR